MEYFDLFGIPVQLKVDKAALNGKFFELSRKYHPDYFAGRPEAEQAEALQQSALLNRAWKTFGDPDATIKYVLKEKGLLEEEEKYELPPDFLMEVLEINEQLMDGDATEIPIIQSTIFNLQSGIYAPVKETVENYKDGITTEKELLQVKEYYYKKKYLNRIKDKLGK